MKHTFRFGNKMIRTDFGFLAILLLLFFTSCFALYNCFNLISSGSGSYYLQRQIMWYGVGFLAMFMITRFKNEAVFKYLDLFYKILLGILLYMFASRMLNKVTGYTLPLAPEINGAISWLQLPLLGSFQASEFMKVVLIIKTAQIVTKYQKKYPNPTFKEDVRMFVELLRWCLVPMLLILLQPDTGVFVIIAVTLVIMISCSVKRRYGYLFLGIIAIFIGVFVYLYNFQPSLLGSLISQYQLNRIEAWLHPDDYILGSSNQLYTALLSLGSAGLTGHGLQANIIAIPEAYTDFIFAAFGQCFGLLGTVYILFICLLLDLYLCRLAINSKNQMDRMIIIGTIAMLFYQQSQNLGMIIGLLPITGITLPLISYGGSSTLSYFILFGVIFNLSPSAKKDVHVKLPKMKYKINWSKIRPQRKPKENPSNQKSLDSQTQQV